ncbi:hypothetical protein H0H92_004255 [Tricholoma furcatifolium]|nr:hypothetical protein H0H92_004255 [Tricholoma furcatifolium]
MSIPLETLLNEISEAGVTTVLEALSKNLHSHEETLAWAHQYMKKTYSRQISMLSSRDFGFHFDASATTENKLQEFDVAEVMMQIKGSGGLVCDLLDGMLSSVPHLVSRRERKERTRKKKPIDQGGDVEMNDGTDDEEYWVFFDETVPIVEADEDQPENLNELVMEQHNQLLELKKLSLGQGLTALYAYDNLDFDARTSVPTLEKREETMLHLTSGTMLPMHEVNVDDLRCSEELWKRSTLNRNVSPNDLPKISFEDIVAIHPDTEHPSGLLRSEQFNAWKYRYDLVHYGPEYFRKFKGQLGEPELIEAIPLKKTTQVPLRALALSPSTASNNAEAMNVFFKQANIGDPNDDPDVAQAIDDTVILVSGDLLTGERIRSLVQSRAEEKTPWRRFQFVVYVMGLFHLKMACADAVWRIFLHPKKAKDDPNSLLNHVSQICPKETGKIESNPGFRRMHEVIQHVGIVSRLGDWTQKASVPTLAEFADAKPTWETIKSISEQLVRESVAGGTTIADLRACQERDQEWENLLLRQQYFLLRAVRMNILVNPTGRKGAFHAIDWVVEHNNLYTKRIYGGKFSNHTLDRILEESPLIEVYKNTRVQFEKMFGLNHKTTWHSPPKMTITFAKLSLYMSQNQSNQFVAGRTSKYCIPEALSLGLYAITTQKGIALQSSAQEENVNDNTNLEDGELEVEDDGGLDV